MNLGEKAYSMDDFIPLTLGRMEKVKKKKEEDKAEVSQDKLYKEREEEMVEVLERFDIQEVIDKEMRTVNQGEPGSGKSTLLKYIVYKESRRMLRDGWEEHKDKIPLYLPLNYWALEKESFIEAFKSYNCNSGCEEFFDKLEKLIKDGNALILLDALDEVTVGRDDFIRRLNDFVGGVGKNCKIIVTTRFAGYSNELADWSHYDVMPFEEKDKKRFFEVYFGKDAPEVNDSIKALNTQPQMKALSSNPLLLKLMCLIYGDDKLELPAKRTELYEKVTDKMLKKYFEVRGGKKTNDDLVDKIIELLEKVALNCFLAGKEAFFYKEISTLLTEEEKQLFLKIPAESGLVQNLKAWFNITPDKMEELKDKIDTGRLALLVDKVFTKKTFIKELNSLEFEAKEIEIIQNYSRLGDEMYIFLHLTFQEYFTACALKKKVRYKIIKQTMKNLKDEFNSYQLEDIETLIDGKFHNEKFIRDYLIDLNFDQKDIKKTLNTAERRDDFLRIIEKKLWEWERWQEVILLLAGQLDEQRATDLVNMLLEHDDARPLEESCNPPYSEKDPFRNILFLAARCCGESKISEEIVEKVIRLLENIYEDKNSSFQEFAIQALGETKFEKAVDILIRVLKDEDEYELAVRQYAAKALGGVGSEKAVDALIEVINKNSRGWTWISRYAASALTKISSDKVVDTLIRTLKDGNRYTRRAAVYALGEIGSDKSVEPLVAALKGNYDGVPLDVREVTVAGKTVEMGIKDPDWNVISRYAVSALIKISSEKVVDALIEVIKDKSYVRSSISIEGLLIEIGSKKAIKPLIRTLKDEDKDVRRSAARALGEIGSEKAIKPLIRTLKDEDKDVRSSVAEALGEIGSEKAIKPLIRALKDKDKYVRSSVAEALGEIGSEKSLEPLIRTLKDKDKYVRSSVAEALGEIGSEKAIKPLLEALKDEHEGVRYSAVRALGEIGSEKAIKPLLEALKGEGKYVRSSAVGVLNKICKKLRKEKEILNPLYYVQQKVHLPFLLSQHSIYRSITQILWKLMKKTY